MSRKPDPPTAAPEAGLRLDKWLWAARFFKTRSLAAEAVEGGRVRLDGQRVKPAKTVKVGDRLEARIGELTWELIVLALSDRRGPAPVARALYQETEASQARRAEQVAAASLAGNPAGDLRGRPTKRAGRLIRRFTHTE